MGVSVGNLKILRGSDREKVSIPLLKKLLPKKDLKKEDLDAILDNVRIKDDDKAEKYLDSIISKMTEQKPTRQM